MKNNDTKLDWLKTKTRNAAILQFCISILIFICFVSLRPPIGDWQYYLTFFVGAACGIFIDKKIKTRGLGLPCPLVFVPLNRKKPLRMSETEAVKYLLPFWKRFPRICYLFANIPYLIILAVIVLLARQQDFTFKYAVWAFFFGFTSNVGLSDGAFFTYIVCTWKKVYN